MLLLLRMFHDSSEDDGDFAMTPLHDGLDSSGKAASKECAATGRQPVAQ